MHRFSRLTLVCALALCAPFGAVLCAAPAPGHASAKAQETGKTLTIERLFSSPSLSGHLTHGIEWVPGSKQISFLERTGEGTELWTMDASSGERKILVSAVVMKEAMQPQKKSAIQSTGLGRVQAENYMWAPGGDSLLFIGSSNLVILDLKSMSSRELLSGTSELEDPKFSPDGKWVSFVRDSNLSVVNVANGAVTALTAGGSEEILKGKLDWVYPEELDARTAYWWSPDSSKIAYYQMDERKVTRYPIMDMSSPTGAMEYTRYPQAGEANPVVRVGVVAVTGGDTTWMDTGADTDVYLPRVVWLHDGRRVAIERLNRAQNRLDLLFCSAADGTSQTILTDTDPYWINMSDDLYFFSDNRRFLWSSERTGYRHYYLYDVSGKLIEPLDTGDWGVIGGGNFGPGASSQAAVDEAHGYIYFSSNKDDVHDSQLYRLSLRDKSITRITKDPGNHGVTMAPDDSAFVDMYSNSMTPPRQDLDRIDGSRIAAIDENHVAELADFHLSPVEFLNVTAGDGTKLCAMMIKPPDFDPAKKYPVLINVYGGPRAHEVVNRWGGFDFLWHEMMAEKGYIIFQVDNRGSYERGHAFETPIFHQFGKVELADQLSGVAYLKSLPYVDPSRIGIWGWSYGGYMTLYSLLNAPGVFKAGVSVAPVTDWRLYDTIYTERYMGRPQDNPEGYKNSSPVHQAANLKDKLLLIHATGDDNVHFANTAEMLNEFIDNGKYPTDLLLFPGRGHGISDAPARNLLFERITHFLLNNL